MRITVGGIRALRDATEKYRGEVISSLSSRR
jgi:hypothetical protein